jgi:hypothetical protein
MNKQLQIVSFEQAERLKKAGFDWKTEHVYIPDSASEIYERGCICPEYKKIPLPTVAIALKWFRDIKKIANSVYQLPLIGQKSKEYKYSFNKTYGCIHPEKGFSTYEAAEIALLDELLTILENEQRRGLL